ncbi:MAG: FG-GAP-like repeat-containing protein, partial [Planctomycetota bacterium]
TVRWPSGAVQTFRDLAADRHYEVREPKAAEASRSAADEVAAAPPLLVAASPLPVRHRERDFDDYAVQPLLPHRLSRKGPGLAVGDIDGDGDDDVYVGGAAGQSGTLLRSRGDCVFEPVPGPWSEDAECEDMGAVFFDCDGDSDLDLYVSSGGVEAGDLTELLRDRLYVNDGSGTFHRAGVGVLPDLRRSSGPVCVADFDGDSDLDLFVGTMVRPSRFPESEASVLLRNDGGVFVEVTASVAPGLLEGGMVTAAVWAHIDGDSHMDLVVAAQWQPLRLFRNVAGKTLVDVSADFFADRPSGQWQSLLAEDLDEDGRVELIVGNLGLNTKYKASAERPLRLYAADLDGSGTFDVIEAKEQDGKLLPVRGLSCSSEAIPHLKVAFPTYDEFARATLPEIYGNTDLESARELRCDELRHLVFHRKDGPFRAMPLPRAAQIAPVQGIAVADVDGDSVLDLVLAHNSYSPEPETGRFDGGLGLVLRGVGGLSFEAVPPLASGFAQGGDQKALAVLDLDRDGSADFLLATNDGPVHAFLSPRRERGVSLRLRGNAGNPDAVGARVMVVSPDGRSQRRSI